jgi:hypothetical protein
LTDSFTWEDLPIKDPETGYSTKAGYIPIIQRLAKYIAALICVVHSTQSTVQLVMNHDMVFTAWYPLDASSSPAYEIANFLQVKQNT